MMELERDLRVIDVLAKFENDPWKIMDVRVLTGLVCPPACLLGQRQYPGALKGCGIKTAHQPIIMDVMVYKLNTQVCGFQFSYVFHAQVLFISYKVQQIHYLHEFRSSILLIQSGQF